MPKCVCGQGSAQDPFGSSQRSPEIPSWIWGNWRAGKGREERRGMVGDGRVGEGPLRMRIPGSLFFTPVRPWIQYSVDYMHYCNSKSAETLSLNVTHNWFDDIRNFWRNFLFLSLIVSWTWWHSKSVIHCSTTDWSLVKKFILQTVKSSNFEIWCRPKCKSIEKCSCGQLCRQWTTQIELCPLKQSPSFSPISHMTVHHHLHHLHDHHLHLLLLIQSFTLN